MHESGSCYVHPEDPHLSAVTLPPSPEDHRVNLSPGLALPHSQLLESTIRSCVSERLSSTGSRISCTVAGLKPSCPGWMSDPSSGRPCPMLQASCLQTSHLLDSYDQCTCECSSIVSAQTWLVCFCFCFVFGPTALVSPFAFAFHFERILTQRPPVNCRVSHLACAQISLCLESDLSVLEKVKVKPGLENPEQGQGASVCHWQESFPAWSSEAAHKPL